MNSFLTKILFAQYDVLLTIRHTLRTKIHTHTQDPPHIKLSTAILDFAAYRFINR
jgi:hypothetical protein